MIGLQLLMLNHQPLTHPHEASVPGMDRTLIGSGTII